MPAEKNHANNGDYYRPSFPAGGALVDEVELVFRQDDPEAFMKEYSRKAAKDPNVITRKERIGMMLCLGLVSVGSVMGLDVIGTTFMDSFRGLH